MNVLTGQAIKCLGLPLNGQNLESQFLNSISVLDDMIIAAGSFTRRIYAESYNRHGYLTGRTSTTNSTGIIVYRMIE